MLFGSVCLRFNKYLIRLFLRIYFLQCKILNPNSLLELQRDDRIQTRIIICIYNKLSLLRFIEMYNFDFFANKIVCSFFYCICQSQKGQLTSKLNYRWFPSYLLCTLLLIFYLSWCTLPDFPSDFSLAYLPFLSYCHRTTTTTADTNANNCIALTRERAQAGTNIP